MSGPLSAARCPSCLKYSLTATTHTHQGQSFILLAVKCRRTSCKWSLLVCPICRDGGGSAG